MLMVVYFMHMVLFQALMAGPVNNKIDSNFKPLFACTHTTPPAHSPNHPAVSYYTMMAKQGIIGLRSCIDILVSYAPVGAFFNVNTSILTERRYQQMPRVMVHLCDDNFRLYQAFRSFSHLIFPTWPKGLLSCS